MTRFVRYLSLIISFLVAVPVMAQDAPKTVTKPAAPAKSEAKKSTDKEKKKSAKPADAPPPAPAAEPKDEPAKKEEAKSEEASDAKPAPAAESSEEEVEEDPLVKVFGDGGLDLVADKITSTINPETNELQTMHIQGGVNVDSELMDLKCEDLLIDMEKQLMIAKGKVVDFKKDDVTGTCGRLTYDMESKKTLLEGKPKPFITQTDAKGRVSQTSADIITMVQTDKGNNVNWDGHVEFKVLPTEEKKEAKPGAPAAEGEKEAPKKIEPGAGARLRSPSSDSGR